jgi:hypothetical protein
MKASRSHNSNVRSSSGMIIKIGSELMEETATSTVICGVPLRIVGHG